MKGEIHNYYKRRVRLKSGREGIIMDTSDFKNRYGLVEFFEGNPVEEVLIHKVINTFEIESIIPDIPPLKQSEKDDWKNKMFGKTK